MLSGPSMHRRDFLATGVVLAAQLEAARSPAKGAQKPTRAVSEPRSLNPNTQWLREAKWGVFTHYLVHMPSAPVPKDMTPAQWNARVNSFDAPALAEQLSSVGAAYFFITIGQGGGYYCSPNNAYERTIGQNSGKLSTRDLVADCAAAMRARNIRQCVYLPAVARREPAQQENWRAAIREWSLRWGDRVSAWWIDGKYASDEEFAAFTAAFKAGNPAALVAYNTGPVGMNRDQLLPATVHEDYLAGECDYFLPTCGVRVFDNKQYYLGPNISGDQLHFLNFLGAWWSTSEPRFSPDLVTSWTRHINDHGGTVTWDLPVSPSGVVAQPYLDQLAALKAAIPRG